jgi:hypothetical protein
MSGDVNSSYTDEYQETIFEKGKKTNLMHSKVKNNFLNFFKIFLLIWFIKVGG